MKNMILSGFIVMSMTWLSAVSLASEKKILLVSDIDDTIKVSHILGLTSKYVRALNITTPFTGMSQLYQLMVSEHGENIHVAYLSNAPQEIQGVEVMRMSHEKFLELNYFPKGDLLLRADIKDPNHKINSIRELIKNQNPDLVIMVGDNGERDAEVYAQATKELKAAGVDSMTYIHQVYSAQNRFFEIGKKLELGQIGFVTPFEIALHLNEKDMLTQESIDWMTQEIMPLILEEDEDDPDTLGDVAFPSFMKCRDFKWTIKVPKSLVPLASKINKRCR